MNAIATAGWIATALGTGAMALALPVEAQVLYRQRISNDMSKCAPGAGPAVRVSVQGVQGSSGTLRVQSYRGTKEDWLEKGKWIYRIETPARAGTMVVCMPFPESGTYGIAVRHDKNNNGKTDLREDGGGMSNNPAISIFNLGKPHYKKAAFTIDEGVQSIAIEMKYW